MSLRPLKGTGLMGLQALTDNPNIIESVLAAASGLRRAFSGSYSDSGADRCPNRTQGRSSGSRDTIAIARTTSVLRWREVGHNDPMQAALNDFSPFIRSLVGKDENFRKKGTQINHSQLPRNSSWFVISSAGLVAISLSNLRICSPTEYCCCFARIIPAWDLPWARNSACKRQ